MLHNKYSWHFNNLISSKFYLRHYIHMYSRIPYFHRPIMPSDPHDNGDRGRKEFLSPRPPLPHHVRDKKLGPETTAVPKVIGQNRHRAPGVCLRAGAPRGHYGTARLVTALTRSKNTSWAPASVLWLQKRIPTKRAPKTTEVHSLTVWGPGVQSQGAIRAVLPLKAGGKDPSCLPSSWWLQAVATSTGLCLCPHITCSSGCVKRPSASSLS